MAQTSSPGFRTLFAVVFLGLAAATLAAVWPEFAHLVYAMGREWHHGDPPNPVAIAAGTLAVASVLVIGIGLARRRGTPLPFAVVVLTGFAGGLIVLFSDPPRYRSWQQADLAILQPTQALAGKMIDGLQLTGTVSPDVAVWQGALASIDGGAAAPARDKRFAPRALTIEKGARQGEVAPGTAPATLVVWTSPDGVAFELTPVGFAADDSVGPLVDDRGNPIVFKGVYNQR